MICTSGLWRSSILATGGIVTFTGWLNMFLPRRSTVVSFEPLRLDYVIRVTLLRLVWRRLLRMGPRLQSGALSFSTSKDCLILVSELITQRDTEHLPQWPRTSSSSHCLVLALRTSMPFVASCSICLIHPLKKRLLQRALMSLDRLDMRLV